MRCPLSSQLSCSRQHVHVQGAHAHGRAATKLPGIPRGATIAPTHRHVRCNGNHDIVAQNVDTSGGTEAAMSPAERAKRQIGSYHRAGAHFDLSDTHACLGATSSRSDRPAGSGRHAIAPSAWPPQPCWQRACAEACEDTGTSTTHSRSRCYLSTAARLHHTLSIP